MKIKVLNKTPPITDQEIFAKMDFQSLLQQRNAFLKARKSRRAYHFKAITTITILILLTAAISFFFYKKSKNKMAFIAPDHQLVPDWNHFPLDSEYTKEDPIPVATNTIKHTKEKIENSKKKPEASPTAKINKQEKSPKPISDKNTYKEAYPLVGMDSLLNYLSTHLDYPKDALGKSIPVYGTTIVYFTIDTTGAPNAIKIGNSLDPSFDKEAIRLILSMPQWEPARFNNKLTESHLSIPLSFKPKETDSNY
jgi:hypothetical protein